MINLIALLIFLIIIFVTESTLIFQHGKIMNYPLRKKLISDISNIILFLIMFWYSFKFLNRPILFCSSIIYICILLLYISVAFFVQIIMKKIALGTPLINSIKDKFSKILRKTETDNNASSHNPSSYRECMLLTVIHFCKLTIIVFSILLLTYKFITIYRPEQIIQFIPSIEIEDSLSDLFILINNAGLLFTSYKFYFDKKAIKQEKSDNDRYLQIVKRLDRNEHSI